MAVDTNRPEVAQLICDVEQRFGRSVITRSDFAKLVNCIEDVTSNHISENTLRRLWGRISGYVSVFVHTLDVLAQYVGYEHWDAYLEHIARLDNVESSIIATAKTVKSCDLNIGDRVRIGWLPNRLCIVEYLGHNKFVAVETHNSTLQPGDVFECGVMIKNHPLFIDNLVHGNEYCPRYSIGLNNGLTTLEKL